MCEFEHRDEPFCDYCGEYKRDDEMFNYECSGEVVCKRCFNLHYALCHHCGHQIRRECLIDTQDCEEEIDIGVRVCEDCYQELKADDK